MNSLIVKIMCLLLLLMPLNYALAKDRVLLIGVGEFKHNHLFQPFLDSLRLPGVDKDIRLMRSLLIKKGYADTAIKTLQNQQASFANIFATIEQWLVKGVGENDRVILYISTHGSKVFDENGDEDDGFDEVLLAYDAYFARQQDNMLLKNSLVDDQLFQLLSRIPAKKTLVIIDACYSGGVFKSFAIKQKQSFKFKYAPNVHAENRHKKVAKKYLTKAFARHNEDGGHVGYVLLSAASENQLAVSLDNGSLFTQGLSANWGAVNTVTPELLRKRAERYITEALLDSGYEYQPQLLGNAELFNIAF